MINFWAIVLKDTSNLENLLFIVFQMCFECVQINIFIEDEENSLLQTNTWDIMTSRHLGWDESHHYKWLLYILLLSSMSRSLLCSMNTSYLENYSIHSFLNFVQQIIWLKVMRIVFYK